MKIYSFVSCAEINGQLDREIEDGKVGSFSRSLGFSDQQSWLTARSRWMSCASCAHLHARHLANARAMWRREKPECSPPYSPFCSPFLSLSLLAMPEQWSSAATDLAHPPSLLHPSWPYPQPPRSALPPLCCLVNHAAACSSRRRSRYRYGPSASVVGNLQTVAGRATPLGCFAWP